MPACGGRVHLRGPGRTTSYLLRDVIFCTTQPPENLESIGKFIRDIPFSEIGTFIAETANSLPKIVIQEYKAPDFANMKQVIVDVITPQLTNLRCLPVYAGIHKRNSPIFFRHFP